MTTGVTIARPFSSEARPPSVKVTIGGGSGFMPLIGIGLVVSVRDPLKVSMGIPSLAMTREKLALARVVPDSAEKESKVCPVSSGV